MLGCKFEPVTTRTMHAFPELIDRCTAFTLQALAEAQATTIEALQTSAATPLVKTLQMVQLQKVVSFQEGEHTAVATAAAAAIVMAVFWYQVRR